MDYFTEEEIYLIIKMYRQGFDIDDIIKQFKSEESNIREVLKFYQIDRKYNTFSQELNNRVIYLYQSNYTQKRICEVLKVSENGIKKILKRNGIKKRSYSECNRRYALNEHYFDTIDTPNKAYILGLLYADGCNHLSHNSITLSLQESDLSILKSIKKELNYEGPIRFVEKNKKNFRHKNQYVLCINDEYMSKQLERLGMVNAKSLKLLWPTFLPKDLISHFVRGYFDGDGCVWYDKKRNKCETQICGTRNFCENLSIILSNMSCKNSIKHPKQCNENTVVLQTKGNKSSYQILSWMYQDSDLKLDRKYQKYLEFCKSLNKPQLN